MKVLEGHRAHLAHLQYPRLRRRRLGHDAVGDGASSPTTSTRTRTFTTDAGRRAVRQHGDHHRRRPVAARALPADRAQVGQPGRRERDRLRHRALRLQADEARQRRAVGGRAGTAAAHRRSLARVSDDRPSQRRLLLAISRDHSTADGRGLPPRGSREAAGESAETDRARRSRPRVHAGRDRHHHLRRPGARARADREGASGRRGRRRPRALSRQTTTAA